MNRYTYAVIALLIVIIAYAYMQQLNFNTDGEVPAETSTDTSPPMDYAYTLQSLVANYDKNLQYTDPKLHKSGLVTADKVNIRSHPDTEAASSILTTVSRGDRLNIVDEDTHWYQIRYETLNGWIHKDYIQPIIEIQTTDGSSLELTFSSNNILEISGEYADQFSLINENNGKYRLVAENLQFTEHIFDLHHPAIPVLIAKEQQIEIYTQHWLYANLLTPSDTQDTQTQIVFTPTIYDIEYRSEADRDIYVFHTSGAPEYQLAEQPDTLQLILSPAVATTFALEDDEKTDRLQSLLQTQNEYIFTAKEPVNWKVSSSDNLITVDISNRGIAGKRIVVDPGHGGKEKGTYGRKSEIREKDSNLALSKYLVQALEQLGAEVIVTRDSDTIIYQGEQYTTFMDLMARVDIAKQQQADLFISLHADNFPADLSIQGTTAYYYSHYPHAAQNQKLAELIGEAVAEAADMRWLGAKEQTFAVIRYNPYPAVLIEYGFLSNLEDEAKLIDPVYQKKMADATAQAIAEYYK